MNESQAHDNLLAVAPQLRPTGPAQRLSGGLLNHVFRIPCDSGDVVLKHTLPHVATNPQIAMDPARLEFEVRAMTFVSEHVPALRVPRPIAHDLSRAILVMEHFDALGDLTHVEHVTDDMLHRLGHAIASLHARTYQDEELARDMRNQSVQQTRLDVQYQGVETWLRGQVPDDVASRAGRTARHLGQHLTQPGVCLVMGDLWPPSVLWGRHHDLCLIDWEFSHFGEPCQDVGHLLAHLKLLNIPGDAFLQSYIQTLGEHPLLAPEFRTRWRHHQACEQLMRWIGPFRDATLEVSPDDILNAAWMLAN